MRASQASLWHILFIGSLQTYGYATIEYLHSIFMSRTVIHCEPPGGRWPSGSALWPGSAVVSLLSARLFRFTSEHCTILDQHRRTIQWQAICGRLSHASTPIFTRGIRVLSSAIWTSPSKCRETNELAKVARGNCQKELPPLPGRPNTKITKINSHQQSTLLLSYFARITLLLHPAWAFFTTNHSRPAHGWWCSSKAWKPFCNAAQINADLSRRQNVPVSVNQTLKWMPQIKSNSVLDNWIQRRAQKTWKATLASDQSKTLSIPTTGMVYSPKANSFKK